MSNYQYRPYREVSSLRRILGLKRPALKVAQSILRIYSIKINVVFFLSFFSPKTIKIYKHCSEGKRKSHIFTFSVIHDYALWLVWIIK